MFDAAKEILRHRGLLASLTMRELKARYRGSTLGFCWSLVNPLLMLAVYTVVFGFIFRQRFATTDPYPLFLITGLFPWIWVSSSVLEGTQAVSANSALIRKAAFPAEILPIVVVLSHLAHFLFALPILGAAFVAARAMDYPVAGWSALALPIVIALQLPLVAGLALGLSALNALFKDVRDLITHLMTLLFFMTPILYSLDIVELPALRRLLVANPFTPFTLAYQDVLFYGRLPGAFLWIQMAAISAVAWAAGGWIFGRLKDTLVEAV